jgi:hypothetical protein
MTDMESCVEERGERKGKINPRSIIGAKTE